MYLSLKSEKYHEFNPRFVSLSLCLKEQYQSFASDSYNLKECTEVDVELLNLKCGKIV